jgi:hypothetical protein
VSLSRTPPHEPRSFHTRSLSRNALEPPTPEEDEAIRRHRLAADGLRPEEPGPGPLTSSNPLTMLLGGHSLPPPSPAPAFRGDRPGEDHLRGRARMVAALR